MHKVAVGKQAGEKQAAIHEGALGYARDHGQRIVLLPRACEQVALSLPSSGTGDGSLTTRPPPSGCELTIDGQRIANGYQPTVAELNALGYMDEDDKLPLPHGDLVVNEHSGQRMAPRWFTSIRCTSACDDRLDTKAAAVPRPASASSAASTPAPADRRPTLAVTVFNTQPFYAEALPFGALAQIQAARKALGHAGVLSPPGSTPETAAALKGSRLPVPNPIRGATPDSGAPGVLAAHGLVHLTDRHRRSAEVSPCVAGGSATCRDGSAPPTARWDFNGQDLANVGRLTVSGDTTVAGDLSAEKIVQAKERLIVGQSPRPPRHWDRHVVGRENMLDAKMEVNGNAYIDRDLQIGARYPHGGANLNVGNGNVTVHNGVVKVLSGYGDFSGGTAAIGNSRLAGVRLPTTRAPGLPCDPDGSSPELSGGNLGLHFDGTSMHVMVCRPHQRDRWGGGDSQTRPMSGLWTRSGDGRAEGRLNEPLAPN